MSEILLQDPATPVETAKRTAFEQRQFERHKVALTISVWLADGTDCAENVNKTALSSPRNACVEDLSVSGLCFISTEAFPVDGVVGIRLRLGTKSFQLEAVVRRRYATFLSGRQCYGCGAQFLSTEQAPQAVVAIARYLKAIHHAANEAPNRAAQGSLNEARAARGHSQP